MSVNFLETEPHLALSVLFNRLGSPRHWHGSRGFSVVVVVVVVVVVGAGGAAVPAGSVSLLATLKWVQLYRKLHMYRSFIFISDTQHTFVSFEAAVSPEK